MRAGEAIGIADDYPVVAESGAFGLPDIAEVVVVSEIGSYSCCDVWAYVPTAWLGRVTVLVYARVGRARVLLQGVPLGTLTTTSAGGFESAIAISQRGLPVRAFEVACQANVGPPLTDGRISLQAWAGRSSLAGSNAVGAPLVSARLVGRSATSGAATEVTLGSGGRVRVRGGGS